MQNAPGNAPDSMDVDRPLFDLTIVEARALLASGRMTATAYHSALRQRAESVAGYNTMVTSLEAPEIAQPGPLQHIPIVVRIVGGGFAPAISEWLIEKTGNSISISIYLMVFVAISLTSLALLKASHFTGWLDELDSTDAGGRPTESLSQQRTAE